MSLSYQIPPASLKPVKSQENFSLKTLLIATLIFFPQGFIAPKRGFLATLLHYLFYVFGILEPAGSNIFNLKGQKWTEEQ
jgi:hypothetical protein